jgi:hypothetical protein
MLAFAFSLRWPLAMALALLTLYVVLVSPGVYFVFCDA